MDQGKRKLATSLLAAASLTTTAASVKAVTFAEPGDAGQTLATATYTAATAAAANQPLTAITGTIAGTNGLDADIYVLTLTGTTAFSATASSSLDTSLFLFNSSGAPVLANDDNSSGTSLDGTIPATTLPAGRYYLAIALSGNEPRNSANQFLFTSDNPTTNVRGPASGLNPTALSIFDGQTSFPEGGAYTLTLTGATTAVPEPTTVVTLTLGAAASLAFARRIRRQQANA